jgi:hypothetical protein
VRVQGHVFTVISPTGTPLYSFADRREAEAEAVLLNESDNSREATGIKPSRLLQNPPVRGPGDERS